MFCKAVCCIVKLFSDLLITLVTVGYTSSVVEIVPKTRRHWCMNWMTLFVQLGAGEKYTTDPTFEQLWWAFSFVIIVMLHLQFEQKRWPNFEVNTSHYEVACLVLLCLWVAGVAAAQTSSEPCDVRRCTNWWWPCGGLPHPGLPCPHHPTATLPEQCISLALPHRSAAHKGLQRKTSTGTDGARQLTLDVTKQCSAGGEADTAAGCAVETHHSKSESFHLTHFNSFLCSLNMYIL